MSEVISNQTSSLPSSGNGLKKSLVKLLPLLVIILFVVVGVSLLAGQNALKKTTSSKPTKAVTVPTQYTSVSGKVVTIKDNVLTIDSNSQPQAFKISPKVNIQRKTASSTIVKLDAKSELSISDIELGQTVRLQVDKNNVVASILIVQ